MFNKIVCPGQVRTPLSTVRNLCQPGISLKKDPQQPVRSGAKFGVLMSLHLEFRDSVGYGLGMGGGGAVYESCAATRELPEMSK